MKKALIDLVIFDYYLGNLKKPILKTQALFVENRISIS